MTSASGHAWQLQFLSHDSYSSTAMAATVANAWQPTSFIIKTCILGACVHLAAFLLFSVTTVTKFIFPHAFPQKQVHYCFASSHIIYLVVPHVLTASDMSFQLDVLYLQ